MTFIKMLRDETGASAAEYALILAIVGTGIAAASLALGGNIEKAMTGASEQICQEPGADAPDGAVNLCEEDGTGTGGGGTTTPPPSNP